MNCVTRRCPHPNRSRAHYLRAGGGDEPGRSSATRSTTGSDRPIRDADRARRAHRHRAARPCVRACIEHVTRGSLLAFAGRLAVTAPDLTRCDRRLPAAKQTRLAPDAHDCCFEPASECAPTSRTDSCRSSIARVRFVAVALSLPAAGCASARLYRPGGATVSERYLEPNTRSKRAVSPAVWNLMSLPSR
jgi:hypothetical protein